MFMKINSSFWPFFSLLLIYEFFLNFFFKMLVNYIDYIKFFHLLMFYFKLSFFILKVLVFFIIYLLCDICLHFIKITIIGIFFLCFLNYKFDLFFLNFYKRNNFLSKKKKFFKIIANILNQNRVKFFFTFINKKHFVIFI